MDTLSPHWWTRPLHNHAPVILPFAFSSHNATPQFALMIKKAMVSDVPVNTGCPRAHECNQIDNMSAYEINSLHGIIEQFIHFICQVVLAKHSPLQTHRRMHLSESGVMAKHCEKRAIGDSNGTSTCQPRWILTPEYAQEEIR